MLELLSSCCRTSFPHPLISGLAACHLSSKRPPPWWHRHSQRWRLSPHPTHSRVTTSSTNRTGKAAYTVAKCDKFNADSSPKRTVTQLLVGIWLLIVTWILASLALKARPASVMTPWDALGWALKHSLHSMAQITCEFFERRNLTQRSLCSIARKAKTIINSNASWSRVKEDTSVDTEAFPTVYIYTSHLMILYQMLLWPRTSAAQWDVITSWPDIDLCRKTRLPRSKCRPSLDFELWRRRDLYRHWVHPSSSQGAARCSLNWELVKGVERQTHQCLVAPEENGHIFTVTSSRAWNLSALSLLASEVFAKNGISSTLHVSTPPSSERGFFFLAVVFIHSFWSVCLFCYCE